MPEIGSGTLAMAIRAVQARIEALAHAAEPDSDPDDQERLFAYERAADELRAAYIAAERLQINLRPYEELVAG